MWKTVIRENLGIIFAFAVLILVRTRRQLLRRLGKIVTFAATYFRCTISAPAFYSSTTTPRTISPLTTHTPITRRTTYDTKYPNSVLYFRRRFFGTEYFVIQSTYVARATLAKHAEYFENVSFLYRIFRFCRRNSNTSSSTTSTLPPLKRLEHVIRAHINDHRNEKNSKTEATEVGGCNTTSSFPRTAAAVDKAYQKFAMEMNAKNGEKLGHHLRDQTLFEDEEKKRRRRQRLLLQRQRQQVMELPATVAFDVKNGCDPSSRREVAKTSSLEIMIPGLKSCIKEMVVLLEAKANRKIEIDIRQYGYRHAVNVLGVCFFGKTVEELTSSGCDFYKRFDELHAMWMRSETGRGRRFLNDLLKRFWTKFKGSKRADEVTSYFRKLVIECVDEKNETGAGLLKSMVHRIKSGDEELLDSLSIFVMAFSVFLVEVLAGTISVILHELSQDANLQEKIRDKDKVEFNLHGSPCLNAEFLSESLYINPLIKETFKTFPIDPLIQLSCQQLYRIPNTNFRINPKSVVLIPVNVLQTDNNLYPSMDSFNLSANQEMEEEYDFITDSEMQSSFVFFHQVVDICLKMTLPSVIQIYEFKADVKLNYEYSTSCRFSTLPSSLPLRAAKVEKRGKIVVFEESLKAFHASKDVPFLSKIGL